jgi:hypothetical protein
VASIIEQNADDLGAPGFDIYYGWGRVNAYRALLAAGATPPTSDSTPPTASITSPAAGSVVSGTTTVAVSANDNIGVTQVDLQIDGVLLGSDTTSPYSFAWDTTKYVNASHNVVAIAHDAAGNIGASSGITVTVSNQAADTTPPSVTITSPVNGATVSRTVKLNVSASDNVLVQNVSAFVDGRQIGSTSCSSGSCSTSFSWNTKSAASGAHTLSASAWDPSGNVSQSAPITVYK